MAEYELVVEMFGGQVLCENEAVMIREVRECRMSTGKPIWFGQACDLGVLAASAIGIGETAHAEIEGLRAVVEPLRQLLLGTECSVTLGVAGPGKWYVKTEVEKDAGVVVGRRFVGGSLVEALKRATAKAEGQ